MVECISMQPLITFCLSGDVCWGVGYCGKVKKLRGQTCNSKYNTNNSKMTDIFFHKGNLATRV